MAAHTTAPATLSTIRRFPSSSSSSSSPCSTRWAHLAAAVSPAPVPALRHYMTGPVLGPSAPASPTPGRAVLTTCSALSAGVPNGHRPYTYRPPARATFDVFQLPGMGGAHPGHREVAADELLAAVVAAAPSQATVWDAVAQLLPRLLHITSRGPLLGFALDLETTGTNWQWDRITEIAVVDLASGAGFSSLVNPNGCGRFVELSVEVQEITHIRPDMLRHAPSEEWVALALLVWIYQRCRAVGGARPTLIGHNAKAFDRHFLARHLAFNGCLVPASWCMVDTLSVVRDYKPHGKTGKLEALAEAFSLPPRTAHRALPDTLRMVEVFAAMLRQRSPNHPRPHLPDRDAAARWEVQQALNDGRLPKAAIGSKSKSLIEPLIAYDKLVPLLTHFHGTVTSGYKGPSQLYSQATQAAVASSSGGIRATTVTTSIYASGPGQPPLGTSRSRSMADVLLQKTARAQSIANGMLATEHGLAAASVQLSWTVDQPANPGYYLPETAENLPDKPPSTPAGPLGRAVAQAGEPSDDLLLPSRNLPSTHTSAPSSSSMSSTSSSSSSSATSGAAAVSLSPSSRAGPWPPPAPNSPSPAPGGGLAGPTGAVPPATATVTATTPTNAAQYVSTPHVPAQPHDTTFTNATHGQEGLDPAAIARRQRIAAAAAAAAAANRAYLRPEALRSTLSGDSNAGSVQPAHQLTDAPSGPAESEADAADVEFEVVLVKGRVRLGTHPVPDPVRDAAAAVETVAAATVDALTLVAAAIPTPGKPDSEADDIIDATLITQLDAPEEPPAPGPAKKGRKTKGPAAAAAADPAEAEAPTKKGRKSKAPAAAEIVIAAEAEAVTEAEAEAKAEAEAPTKKGRKAKALAATATDATATEAKAPARKGRKAKGAAAAAAGGALDGWDALAAPFNEEPFGSGVWGPALPARRPSLLEQLRAAAPRLPSPHSLLLHVPRAVVVHRQRLTAGELAAATATKEDLREKLGGWREVKDALKDVEGIPVALRATLPSRTMSVVRMSPRGWRMSALLNLQPGQIITEDGEAARPLETPVIEAAWYDFANWRADIGMRERSSKWSEPGSEWVLRGRLKPKPIAGAKFELVAPDVLPASSFSPSRDAVVVTYRAVTPLHAEDVGAAAAAVIDAMKSGKLTLPDPLPPAAREQLHALLSGALPVTFPTSSLPESPPEPTQAPATTGATTSTSTATTTTATTSSTVSTSSAAARSSASPSRATSAKMRISRTSPHLTAIQPIGLSLDRERSGAGAAGGSEDSVDGPGTEGSLAAVGSAGTSAASSSYPEVDMPGLAEAYDVLHRPTLEHLQELCVVRRPQPQMGAQQQQQQQQPEGGGVELPPVLLTRYQLAGRVVAFHELFFSQLQMQQLRRSVRGPNWAPVSADQTVAAARAALGFQLTGAQERAVQEVLDDMRPERASTMYRLLQGDVGSGKTAVALLALVAAAASGLQGLIVVPTTVLAQQHHDCLSRLLEDIPIAARRRWGLMEPPLLLTGDAKAKEKRLAAAGLADGSIRLAVGTHGLLNITDFKALGLLVLDESHKFGVVQMEKLSNLIAMRPPHVLNMTATPIPRTLAAAMYGHMDVSRLDERPPGRTPVATSLIQDDGDMTYVDRSAVREMDEMWDEVLEELTTGDPPGRAFVVYPLREASDMEELKNAEDQVAVLSDRFGPHGITCQLLHGRTKNKEEVLESFRRGDVRLLVCTTVVEVGVDVPEATVVVVEHAERFGLAQLHQLRGRVGRGSRPGRCYLCVPYGDASTRKRLGIMETTNDGFLVAEWDLEQRGIGHLFGSGTKQHGRMDVSPLTAAVMEEARGRAGGVELAEAARRAAAAVAKDWEGSAGLDEDYEDKIPEDMQATMKAMKVFRTEPLDTTRALAV